jgi:hypothetical protein
MWQNYILYCSIKSKKISHSKTYIGLRLEDIMIQRLQEAGHDIMLIIVET